MSYTAVAQSKAPCHPLSRFGRVGSTVSVLRSEVESAESSRDTTPTAGLGSLSSSDEDEDYIPVETCWAGGVQLEVEWAPSRFQFEYGQCFAPPTGLPSPTALAYHAHKKVINRILCMADRGTRRVCRTLCHAAKAAIDADLLIIPSPVSYPANSDIIHRIFHFANHETRIMCRLLCRQIKARLDREMALSIVLTSIAIEEKLCLHLSAEGKRRIPGLPPQSYDAWDAWDTGRAYVNPAILRHTRTLTFASNLGDITIGTEELGSVNIGLLAPYLQVHTVRDTYPGSQWRHPISCIKYVTLTLINTQVLTGVPQTPDGVRDRVFNISCPRNSHLRYRSVFRSLCLSDSVRRAVIILHFPSVVTASSFHDLALAESVGVLNLVAEEIITSSRVHYTIVGTDTVPATVLGFETRDPIPRPQLEYELYQRILPRDHTFEQYQRLKKRVRFISLAEYRAEVGEKEFAEDFIAPPR